MKLEFHPGYSDPLGFNLISSPTNILTMTAACAHIAANLQLLIAQAKRIAEQNQEMAATTTEELAENIEPPQNKDGGAIWQQLEENNSWVILTNFEKHNILPIYEAIQPSLPS